MPKKVKDIEKAFALTTHRVKVFNHKGKLIVDSEIKRIGHFSVFRDYTIILKSGAEIWLDSGVIDLIVAHEIKEKPKVRVVRTLSERKAIKR